MTNAWKDTFPEAIGTYKTRYRSPSVHGGYIEEELQVYLSFGGEDGTTFRYLNPKSEEMGDVADLGNRQWKGPLHPKAQSHG